MKDELEAECSQRVKKDGRNSNGCKEKPVRRKAKGRPKTPETWFSDRWILDP
jgi:hypothetical protein